MAKWVSNYELINLLFTLISEDPALQGILGTPILIYDTEAPSDPPLPYLVHTVELGRATLEDVVTQGDYAISLYTAEAGNVQLNDASSALIDLLNNQIFSSGEIDYLYLSLEGGNQVETENAHVQRYDLPFQVRYTIGGS